MTAIRRKTLKLGGICLVTLLLAACGSSGEERSAVTIPVPPTPEGFGELPSAAPVDARTEEEVQAEIRARLLDIREQVAEVRRDYRAQEPENSRLLAVQGHISQLLARLPEPPPSALPPDTTAEQTPPAAAATESTDEEAVAAEPPVDAESVPGPPQLAPAAEAAADTDGDSMVATTSEEVPSVEQGETAANDERELAMAPRPAERLSDLPDTLVNLLVFGTGMQGGAPPISPAQSNQPGISTAETGVPAAEPASAEPQVAEAPTQRTAEVTQDAVVNQPSPSQAEDETGDLPLALHLASYKEVDQLREGWSLLREKHGEVIGDLQARIRRVEVGDSGAYFRLIVGPLADRSVADATCRQLRAQGGYCQVAPFDGVPVDAAAENPRSTEPAPAL